MRDTAWNVWVLVVVIGLTCSVVALSVYSSEEEREEWNRFSSQHDCHLVGQREAQHTYGYSYGRNGGLVSTTVPGQSGYLCDDGITYWRNQ